MTLNQHYRTARELWLACEAIKRAWLLTGDVEGPMRPGGEVAGEIRKVVDALQDQFARDWPNERDPYEGITC